MILLQITHSQKTAVVLLNAKGETLYQKITKRMSSRLLGINMILIK